MASASSTAIALALAFASAFAHAQMPAAANPASDAPEQRFAPAAPLREAASYVEALREWRSVDDVNAWIGARFEYDKTRALLLSETQRRGKATIAIYAPPAFFAAPSGVCVDLSRFGVETLRAIAPETKPAYLMIEFSPVLMAGNTLRRHWLVTFERDGKRYFFADSKRPGYIAGPYASTREFIDDYARYRGREVVSYQEAETYERKTRTLATRQSRVEQPLPTE
jgi:hypothetical protein